MAPTLETALRAGKPGLIVRPAGSSPAFAPSRPGSPSVYTPLWLRNLQLLRPGSAVTFMASCTPSSAFPALRCVPNKTNASLRMRVERFSEKTQHMSAPEPSGTPAPAPAPAPAESAAAPAAPATQPFGTFGSTRGSGLARGKRATVNAAPASAPSGYKPSALEVITPKSEYVNPFTGETSVASPVVNEPAPQAAPAPAPIAVPAPVAASAPAPAPAAAPAPAGELFPFNAPASPAPRAPAEPAAKAELNILPPQEAKRPAVSWEAPSASAPADAQPARRDDRATFRTERHRREDSAGKPGETRDQREQIAERLERHDADACRKTKSDSQRHWREIDPNLLGKPY